MESCLLFYFLFLFLFYFLLKIWKLLGFGGVKSSNSDDLAAVGGCVACRWPLLCLFGCLWYHCHGWFCWVPMVSLLWVVSLFLFGCLLLLTCRCYVIYDWSFNERSSEKAWNSSCIIILAAASFVTRIFTFVSLW